MRKRRIYYTLIPLLLGIAVFLPVLIKSPYYIDVFITVLMNTMLAMAFVIVLRTGLVNLSLMAWVGIGSYVSAILVVKLGMSFWLSLPVSALAAGLISFGVGFVLLRGGVGGFAFVVLSTVIGMLFPLIVSSIGYVGGTTGFSQIPAPDTIKLPLGSHIVFDANVDYYYLALVMIVIVVIVLASFYRSWIGTAWTAVGLSSRLADSLGVNVFRYRMMAFVLSSVVCGAVGSFTAHYAGFIMPSTFSLWGNVNVQVYAVLGGISFAIAGPLVGSAVMMLLSQVMYSFVKFQPIITGAILIVLIVFLPGGVLGLMRRGKGQWAWRPYTDLAKRGLARVSSAKGGRGDRVA